MFKSPTYGFLAGATSVQGHRPDFNDLGGDSNSAPVLGPRRLFKSNSNNGPSLGHSNLVSDEVYICSGLLFTISWWLLYLAKDLNSSRSLAPRRLFETDVSNDPPSHSQMKNTSVQVSHL